MAEIVLINPKPLGSGLNEATIEPPLGLAYIASMLRKNGFFCSITDANVLGLSPSQAAAAVTTETQIVGVSVNSFTVSATVAIVTAIRARSSARIIVGGAFPTAAPEKALALTGADAAVIGEGEFPMLAIVQCMARGEEPYNTRIAGVKWNSPESVLSFRQPERIDQLDNLPFPAYDLLPSLTAYRTRARKHPVAAIITSRGCTYDCSFCSKDIFQHKARFRSADNVLAEIDELTKKFGVRQLDILDDNFLQQDQRLEAILEGIIRKDYGLAINLQTGVRTELLDKAMLSLLKKSGVFKLAFGIESGDSNLLRKHHKSLDLARVENVIKTAKRLGFVVYGFFIVGLVGETEASFRKTLDYARKLELDVANFCLAIPFPGTELYRMVQEEGRFLLDTSGNIDSGFYGGRVFYEYEGSSAAEILSRYHQAYKEFYSMKRQICMLLSMRSSKEFLWYCNAVWSVFKGMIAR